MSIRDVPSDQPADAEILAALLGLVPVRSGEVIRLMSKREVMDRIEELRRAGEESETYHLLADLEFDGDTAFRRSFSQITSRSVRVRTSTLYRLLDRMAVTGESRNDIMRRLLAPVVEKAYEKIKDQMDYERSRMLRFSLDGWTTLRRTEPEDIDSQDVDSARGEAEARPVLRTSIENERLPPDLRKYSRYFLKNLFRLNNIYGQHEFVHPPEVVENYWEVVAPDQGVFHAEMVPIGKSLAIGLYRTSRRFGLERSDNPDYYGLVEMLVTEKQDHRIKGCQVELHGATPEDETTLQEALSIETVLYEDGSVLPLAIGIPQPLSAEGLKLLQTRLKLLSGIRAEVRFPVNARDPFCGEQDYSVLGFDLSLDKETGKFLLDEAIVSEPTMDQVVLAVGGKLLALSRLLYREPERFPQPDVDELDREVHELIAKAEREGLDEDAAKEIVAKITVLDYYESLAKYSYALGDQIRRYLEGTQVVTFTIPRVLLALLDREIEEQDIDEMILSALSKEGRS